MTNKKRVHLEFSVQQYGELCSVADYYDTTISATVRKGVELLLLLIRTQNTGAMLLIRTPNELDKELIII